MAPVAMTFPLPPPVYQCGPKRCCRNCEFWDGGGEVLARTALSGDCHNSRSDRFTPEWDHVCQQFYPATGGEDVA